MAPTPTTTAACIPGMISCFSRPVLALEPTSVPDLAFFFSLLKFDCVLLSFFVFWNIRVSAGPTKDSVVFGNVCQNRVPVVVRSLPVSLVPIQQTTPSIPFSQSTPLPAVIKQKKKKMVVILNRATILRDKAIAKKYFEK